VWDTGAAASRSANWIAEVIPTSGNPATSRFAFSYDFNAGGYSEFVCFTSTGNVGVGTASPSARLHLLGTTEQLRVGFDVSNYLNVIVSSNGTVTLDAVGSGSRFVFSDRVNIPTFTPASAGASGSVGDIAWDASYLYVCVAANTWKRAALTTW
jgi:hypothetical protein